MLHNASTWVHYLSSKQGEDTTASTNIHYCFALEVCCIFQDGSIVGSCPDLILQHVLLMHQHAVVVKVQLCTACVSFGGELVLLLLQAAHSVILDVSG